MLERTLLTDLQEGFEGYDGYAGFEGFDGFEMRRACILDGFPGS